MDRRTLLAVLLSMAVIVIFQVFLMPKPGRRPAAPPDSSVAVLAPSHPSGPDSIPALTLVPRATAPARDVVVETALYRALFSTEGALLKSFTLKNFADQSKQPVDLVRGAGEMDVTLVIGGIRQSLGTAPFEAVTRDSAGMIREVAFTFVDTTGLRVEKLFRFADGSYVIDLAVRVSGLSAASPAVDYEVSWSGGLPFTERDRKIDESTMASLVRVGKETERDGIGAFKKNRERVHEGSIQWAAVRSKYFVAALLPGGGASRAATVGDPEEKWTGISLRMPVTATGVTMHEFDVYLGPLDYYELRKVSPAAAMIADLGWRWLHPVTKLMLDGLVLLYRLIPNWGVAIILLSALTKVVFYPLSRSSFQSMRALQHLQPEIARLREKWKGDAGKMNTEMMALYKRHKVNPAGGCLPMLLQMPVFMALYNVFYNAISLRHAPFALWIDDLSSPDLVGRLGPVPIHILPVVMLGAMLLQQKMTPTDPRQASMGYMMTVMMTVFFYSLPSGLVLYWTVNSLMTAAQQWIMIREPHPIAVPVQSSPPASPGDRPPGRGSRSSRRSLPPSDRT
jgi:YidC/Oxa1 family membrane protein insertase